MSIELKNVTYTYSQGTAYESHALKDINLVIPDGQFIGVIDPSLPAMVYIEKRTVRTTLKVGGTFFQVHIAIHHKSAIKNFVGCHGSLAALVKKLQDNAILSFNDIFNI